MEHRRTRYRFAVGLVAVLVLAGGCASSGEPTGFDQQAGPIGDELAALLPGSSADTELPLVERSFLEGCVVGENSTLAELSVEARAETCTCSYDALVTFYRDNANGESAEEREADAYSAFKDLNKDLEEATGVVPANVQTLLEDCTP